MIHYSICKNQIKNDTNNQQVDELQFPSSKNDAQRFMSPKSKLNIFIDQSYHL